MATAKTTTRPAAGTVVQGKDQTERKMYVDFNTAIFDGRVSNSEIVDGQYGEYASVSVITRFADGTDGVAITFNDTGVLTLVKKGYLMVGRIVHVTGTVRHFETSYRKGDEVVELGRPRLPLSGVSVMLGVTPKETN